MEILIVGAGPVGCYTAKLLKESGYNKTVILEEHTTVGRPVQCAGIVSKNLIHLLQSFISDESILNQINGFNIIYPGVKNFFIKIPKVAVIVDREKFDQSIARDLNVEYNQRVSSIIKKSNRYHVKTTNGNNYKADILIGADGPDSLVRRFLLNNYRNNKDDNRDIKTKYYYGMQYQIQLRENYQLFSNDIVQVFFEGDTPFFIWMIPKNGTSLPLGIISNNGKKKLDRFIINKKIQGDIMDVITGKIPIGLIPTYYENIALVGDAACQIKPLTGGGLSYGIQSAQMLVNCIKEQQLDKYDKVWKRRFGREIKFGLRARKIYENLDRTQRKKVFNLFRDNTHLIEEVVNFDHHSDIFREALKRPKLLVEAGKILRFYLEDMLK